MARNTAHLVQQACVAPIPNITFPITKHTEGSRLYQEKRVASVMCAAAWEGEAFLYLTELEKSDRANQPNGKGGRVD